MTFSQVNLQAAQEGCVLLKNNKQVLPLVKSDNISIFGRIQFEYYRSGMGSGGSVHVAYSTNVHDELASLQMQGKGPVINEDVSSLYDAYRKENQFEAYILHLKMSLRRLMFHNRTYPLLFHQKPLFRCILCRIFPLRHYNK